MKRSLLMNSDTLICIWILVFPFSVIEFSTPQKWRILLYFSSIHNYWPPSTWNTLAHSSWGEMERCEKRPSQPLKMRKKKISSNKKTKCVTDFYRQLGLRVWRIILITWRAHKRQTFTLISMKLMWILKFFVYT